MRYFCTYFDRNYLVRGLALYRSLVQHVGPFKLWVLCFDDFTHQALTDLKLDNLIPISLAEFEQGDDALLAAKENRSTVEYYFTCSPSLLLYVLNNSPEIDVLSYLDADLFFYDDPAPIYAALADQSILIIPHRFPAAASWRAEKYGTYNVGLLVFRNDRYGRECLRWWRERCLEWCYDRVEPGRFADQKYLDDWPARFERVVVLEHKGANLAPWNWMNYQIRFRNGSGTVNGQPIIFYHFHGLRLLRGRMYDLASAGQYQRMPAEFRRFFYRSYVRDLRATEKWLREQIPSFASDYSTRRAPTYGPRLLLTKLLKGEIVIDLGS